MSRNQSLSPPPSNSQNPIKRDLTDTAEKRAKELQEETKSALAGRFRKTFVKLSLQEKIKKTALNTGIRFNIVDNYGFDNASMQMFQEAQKQGMNADEQEFAELVNTENARRANKELLIESEE